MFHKLFKNQLGAAVIAELLIAVIVLGLAGLGGYKMHNQSAQAAPKCGDKACFEQKFSACEQAIYTDSSDPSGSIYLEIYGKNNVGCKMLVRYVSGSDPSFVGKDLTCNFNNSMKYQDSVSSTVQNVVAGKEKSCEGTLLQALQNIPAQQ